MMTDDEIIAVVRAHKEGKEIQCRMLGSSREFYGWNITSPSSDPLHPSGSTEGNRSWWNFETHEYRVLHGPRKPREWDLYVSDDGHLYDPMVAPYRLPVIKVREVIEPEIDIRPKMFR